ncbi:probable N-acetyltransferase HLS1 [Diospyros lotus]|uniref:probable N-acetyltransferase HLS1 n=1 Tax=Diospyros lotus TaxID=55363 RepID=UPI00224D14B6|nr:probable N-acetyltransferase HLS1 [Diospyros lotus]XP_052185105.1 probable N-acetyltransferase HLS1 [Diospyros lotus]XP_052185106.1 probable N-acetyltransferase HLS1 [Diospyros lotus]
MAFREFTIRRYNGQRDRAAVEDLERRCEVGPAKHVFLFTDSLGDPICRIRNSPLYKMLVAELENELVGVIQGSIKIVTLHKGLAKVGYLLGLRVCPFHRRKGIASSLVHHLEEWFVANQVDYVYMATEKHNRASVNLFMNKLGFVKFRTPSILVQPVIHNFSFHLRPKIEILKLKIEQAEFLYKKFMASSTEFFPLDIDKVLGNKLSLGTWVAYRRGESPGDQFGGGGEVPKSWAMLSVWNSGEIFKLRMGKSTLPCFSYEMSSRFITRVFPCLKVMPQLPDFFDLFGFYFIYGVHHQGPLSGKLVRTLCKFVHNMARNSQEDCIKVIVTEVGDGDRGLKLHIPHWKLLSYPDDLWCIKALKNEDKTALHELTTTPPRRALFLDPRDV